MVISRFYVTFISIIFLIEIVLSNRVFELSDRFLDVRSNGVWLVMFYAPWCGHCKNLEPIWNQVAQSLVDTEIRVGRIDCTRFTSVAHEFSVSGFPTILFIKGHKTVEYRGDRERSDIVDFARRMDGPAVRYATCTQFEGFRELKKVFFVYLYDSKLPENEQLKDNYTRIAEEFQTVVNFYTAPASCLASVPNAVMPKEQSAYVCKDGSCFQYNEEEFMSQNISLREWVNKERFPAFMKMSIGNFHQLLKSGKYLVVAVLEENQIGGLSLKMSEFRDVVEAIAVNNKNLYHDDFIFGWLGQPEIANNIAIQTLPIPSLIIVNSTTYQYYLPKLEDDEKIPSPQSILELLDQVKNNSAEAFGGETLLYRFHRLSYSLQTSLFGMWKGNPVLTTVLLGLPLGLFSIICYTTCCTDILEATDDDDESDIDERHQKKE